MGLISGTSADGIDAALVRLTGPPDQVRIRLLEFTTIAYPPAIRRRVLRLAGGEPIPVGEVSNLNFLLGDLFAEAALEVCRRSRLAPRRVAVIGSHGQTVFHRGPTVPRAAQEKMSPRDCSTGTKALGQTSSTTV